MQTLYEFLGNDSTHIYEVVDGRTKYIEPWEVQELVNSQTKGRCYYFHDMLGYGCHNDNTDIHRSNFRVFLEEFENHECITVISYPGGGKSIGIDLLCTHERIQDTFTALASYCVLNDTDRSGMAEEILKENWESWIERDFTSALEKKFNADWSKPDEDKLYQLFKELLKTSNQEVVITNSGAVYIKIDLLLAHLHEAPDFLHLEYFEAA